MEPAYLSLSQDDQAKKVGALMSKDGLRHANGREISWLDIQGWIKAGKPKL
jgi:hypothetical protein